MWVVPSDIEPRSSPVASIKDLRDRSLRVVGQRTRNWLMESAAIGNCCPWLFWTTIQRSLAKMTSPQAPGGGGGGKGTRPPAVRLFSGPGKACLQAARLGTATAPSKTRPIRVQVPTRIFMVPPFDLVREHGSDFGDVPGPESACRPN